MANIEIPPAAVNVAAELIVHAPHTSTTDLAEEVLAAALPYLWAAWEQEYANADYPLSSEDCDWCHDVGNPCAYHRGQDAGVTWLATAFKYVAVEALEGDANLAAMVIEAAQDYPDLADTLNGKDA
ncbi:hypothetical protein [Kutzneria albida]|uniref:Uncharacterized protein n=1 Tax=Kutzneria albida DSM 43870 TaxID=1449976 RepID=W5WBX7_9PSEU|nr:hypothetical protein [Kutzneria albida]AHH98255.1 hypothetical protein KALB_4893 [Kutzneria albida DSM 43870]